MQAITQFEKGNQAYARERKATTGATPITITAALVNAEADLGTTKFRRPSQAEVQVIDGDIVYTTDGTTPVAGLAGVGNEGLMNESIWLDGFAAIRDFQAVQGVAAAEIEITLYR